MALVSGGARAILKDSTMSANSTTRTTNTNSITVELPAGAAAEEPGAGRKDPDDSPEEGVCRVAKGCKNGRCAAKEILRNDPSVVLSPNYSQPYGTGTVCAKSYLVKSK